MLTTLQRRTAKYAPPPTATSTTKSAPKVAAKPAPSATVKQKDSPALTRTGSASEDNASGRSTPQPTSSTSTLKRSDSKSGATKDKTAGDIFKSFAKSKAKPKESTPAPIEDGIVPMSIHVVEIAKVS